MDDGKIVVIDKSYAFRKFPGVLKHINTKKINLNPFEYVEINNKGDKQ